MNNGQHVRLKATTLYCPDNCQLIQCHIVLRAAGSSGSGCNTSVSAIQSTISSASDCISAVTASLVDAKLPFSAVPRLVMPLAKSLKDWLACKNKDSTFSPPVELRLCR